MDSNVQTMVLDASAFYAGVPFGTGTSSSSSISATTNTFTSSSQLSPTTSVDVSYLTTPIVYDEISHIKNSHDALGVLFTTGRLSIMSPESEYIHDAHRAACNTGDMPNLSKQDISVIALCIKTGFALVTDDYAISNVMRSLNLQTMPIMTGGITTLRQWQYYCPGCGDVPSIHYLANLHNNKAAKSDKHKISFKKLNKSSSQDNGIECKLCGSMLKRRMIKKHK